MKRIIPLLLVYSFAAIPVQANSLTNILDSIFRKNNSNQELQVIEPKLSHDNKTEEKDILVEEKDGIYFIKIDNKKLRGELKPYYVVNLTTNNDVYTQTGARLVVNAGFFDPKNHQTVSYLTLNGKQILDPHNNKNLMNNLHLKPYMDKILNRSELRILKAKSDGSLKYDIVPHNEVCSDDYEILHSIQGGPGLVPDLRLAEEFFVLTDKTGKIISESASSLSKYARTLVGIKDNNLYFVIATNKHPISLPEAAEILKEAGMEKAMAFDGGGSVSVDFKDDDLHIISDKDQTARRLKSFWIITSEQELKQN